MNSIRDALDRVVLFIIVICCLFAATSPKGFAQAVPPVPKYRVDPLWPKQLPHNWVMGQVSGLAVDTEDHIWVLQRPGSDTPDEIGEASSSPRHAMCCLPAPPVLEFDTKGNLLKAWGGPGKGYDWPTNEHSIYVDRAGDVWLDGNGRTDRQVLEFTNDGKFMRELGHPWNGPADSSDTTMLGRPAGITMDEAAHELYIADGYLNHRVIVFDSITLAFRRMWGAYGHVPNDATPGPYKGPRAPVDQQFRNPVHCVHISNDGLVYVCDRANDRVQVFTKAGKFIKEFFVHPTTLEPGTVCDIAFSHDPSQYYLLVADDTDNVVWILRRSDGAVVGRFGHDGRNAGQFHAIHGLVSDSVGNLYTGEVETGKRVQKFLLINGQ